MIVHTNTAHQHHAINTTPPHHATKPRSPRLSGCRLASSHYHAEAHVMPQNHAVRLLSTHTEQHQCHSPTSHYLIPCCEPHITQQHHALRHCTRQVQHTSDHRLPASPHHISPHHAAQSRSSVICAYKNLTNTACPHPHHSTVLNRTSRYTNITQLVIIKFTAICVQYIQPVQTAPTPLSPHHTTSHRTTNTPPKKMQHQKDKPSSQSSPLSSLSSIL